MSAEIKLKELATNLKNDQCILVLGPKFSFIPGKPPLIAEFPKYLKKEGEMELSPDADGLFIFDKKGQKSSVRTFMQSFFNTNGSLTDLHRTLMEIPFHTMISLNPDKLMARAFEEKGLPHVFAFYNKSTSQNQLFKTGAEAGGSYFPTQARPLIYNLFGSFEDPSSLILDQVDLLDFIFSALSNDKPLPEELLLAIQKAQKFLFIGFEFDKWYLKLILKLLQLEQKDSNYAAVMDSKKLNGTREFYTNQFNLLFVDHEDQAFVSELKGNFEETDLRVIPEGEENILQQKVADLIKQDLLEDALELLAGHFEKVDEEDLLDETDALNGKINRLSNKIGEATITSEEATVQRNKISKSIQLLAKKASE